MFLLHAFLSDFGPKLLMFSQTHSGHTDYIWACKLVGPVVLPLICFLQSQHVSYHTYCGMLYKWHPNFLPVTYRCSLTIPAAKKHKLFQQIHEVCDANSLTGQRLAMSE